jgi:hypothetical protein
VLEDLDQKLDGGEDLHVGVEIVAVGSAIDHGVRAPLVDEQFLERDRRADDVLCERLASLRGAGRNADRCVYREATVGPVDHVIG